MHKATLTSGADSPLTLDSVLDVLGYNIAFLPRNPDEQALRDQARAQS